MQFQITHLFYVVSWSDVYTTPPQLSPPLNVSPALLHPRSSGRSPSHIKCPPRVLTSASPRPQSPLDLLTSSPNMGPFFNMGASPGECGSAHHTPSKSKDNWEAMEAIRLSRQDNPYLQVRATLIYRIGQPLFISDDNHYLQMRALIINRGENPLFTGDENHYLKVRTTIIYWWGQPLFRGEDNHYLLVRTPIIYGWGKAILIGRATIIFNRMWSFLNNLYI